MPYFEISLRATLSSATTGASRVSATSRSWRRHGRGQSKMSSGSITANGSSPTASRACSTAWPTPSGRGCSAMPEATASSTTTWIAGVSTTGKSSLAITFDEGSIRVPIPAARMTAFFTFIAVRFSGLEAYSDLLLARFLCGFACDAKRGDGARLQPLDPDFAAAFLALPVRAVFDSRECLADFAEQLALAIAHPQQEIAIRFERGPIGRDRKSHA